MNDERYRRRRRRLAMCDRSLRERNRAHGRRAAAACALCVTLTVAMVLLPVTYGRERRIAFADDDALVGCAVDMLWPVREPTVLQTFDGPAQPWLSGHRGVDLAAEPGDDLRSPVSGVIAFAGMVAGKSVVSIAYGDLTLTFEPAVTDLAVGATVRQGLLFATVEGASDHCGESCVHWGIRAGDRRYLDPASQAGKRRIALKPTA